MKPEEVPHTRECEGCDVAGSNREHQRAPRTERHADEQEDRGEVDQEERTKRTNNLHTQDKAGERDAKKAKEEAVKNVAESMHECNQHERVLRS